MTQSPVDGILLKGVAAEKIAIIGVESHVRGEFQLEFPNRLGDSKARLERMPSFPRRGCRLRIGRRANLGDYRRTPTPRAPAPTP